MEKKNLKKMKLKKEIVLSSNQLRRVLVLFLYNVLLSKIELGV